MNSNYKLQVILPNGVSFFKKKGDYFGEIALVIDSKRTADVKSSDFTLCEIFTRESYEMLKKEFLDVGKRLKEGLNHLKLSETDRYVKNIKKTFLAPLQEDDVFYFF